MKKSILGILAVALLALPFATQAQLPSYSNTAQGGVSLFTGFPATATALSAAIRLPAFSGSGTLTVTEAGTKGSIQWRLQLIK
jgi:hypothetical protein